MERPVIIILLFALLPAQIVYTQTVKGYTPRIEPCACPVKVDTTNINECGYLVVPENRHKPDGKTIKLPFIYVKSNHPGKKKDPVLYSSGGPGGSSLDGARWAGQRFFFTNRDYIAFEQRGTQYALPCLGCPEVGEAKKEAYKNNLSKDSAILDAVKRCRQKWVKQGVDLSAYTTIESAADIEDLRLALKIDSLNLLGISYSGGLMLTVLRNYPSGIRSLILDSPLPGWANYDQDALFTINDALHKIFRNCETDSSNRALYSNLEGKFKTYFSSIGGKDFFISYAEKETEKTLSIKYTRDDLLEVLTNKLSSNRMLKDIPFIITEIIRGNHAAFIKEILDDIFNPGINALGMRYSVYCTEQIAFEDPRLINRANSIFPHLAGYSFNNVNHTICDCWKAGKVSTAAKQPVYSNTPILLAAGDTDPWCSPLYNDIIHQYTPNSQRLLFSNHTHGPLLSSREGDAIISSFLDEPYKKLMPGVKEIKPY